MKRIISAIVALILALSSISTVASADNSLSVRIDDPIIVNYVLTNSCRSNLSIDSGKASMTSSAYGLTKVTKITATQTLEKKNGYIWNAVSGSSFTKTVNSYHITMSNSKNGLSSGTYRLKTVFVLKSSDGKTETATAYSDEQTIS